MKVGIYTIHAAHNFGAMLQAFATQYIIKSFGIDVEIVNDHPNEKLNAYLTNNISLKSVIKNIYALVNPLIWIKSKRFRDFHKSMPLSKKYKSINDIYKNPPKYDIHLVGSDQVWNIERKIDKHYYYFLDFLPRNETCISYASSFGNSNVSNSVYPLLQQLLSKFNKLSVREKGGVKLIKRATGLDATLVLDPTLLLTDEQWSKFSSTSPIIKGKYILYYGFDKSENCYQIIKSLRLSLQLPIVAISVSTTTPYKFDKFIQAAGPKEFINLFKHAFYIITSSFHGVAFSVNFQKNFIVMQHGTRMERIESLLDIIGQRKRIVSSVQELKELLINDKNIDYQKCSRLIIETRNYSIRWLKNALLENDQTRNIQLTNL